MSLRIALICLLAIVVGSHSACQDAKPQGGFDNSKVIGAWYVLYIKTPFDDERTSKCTQSIFAVSPDKKLTVHMKGDNVDITGDVIPDPTTPGHFTVTWRGKDYDFVVTDTDYEHYSLSTACTEGDTEGNPSYIFIHSRTPELPQETIYMMKRKLEDRNIDLSALTKINQDGC